LADRRIVAGVNSYLVELTRESTAVRWIRWICMPEHDTGLTYARVVEGEEPR